MDSVAVEKASLQRDLAEVETELRRVRENLAELAYVERVKPAYVNEQRALARQLDERRARIAENLARVEERRPGGLPSPQSGIWTPLALFEPMRHDAEPQRPVEHRWTPAEPLLRPSPADTADGVSAELIAMFLKRPDNLAARFAELLSRAGDDIPSLRLIRVAASAMDIEVAARTADERLRRLGDVD